MFAEFKRDMTKLPEKHNFGIQQQQNTSRITQLLWKLLRKQLVKTRSAQELQNLVSAIRVKNLRSIVNKIKNTKSSIEIMAFMISSIIPSQYPIKPSIFELDKSEIYSEEKVVHEDVYTNISLHQPG